MAFSKRVGMEPANDLKKQIGSLCEEAGFVVAASQISMHRNDALQDSFRVIHTWVHEPSWNPTVPDVFAGSAWEEHKDYQIGIRAFILCDGTFGGTVEVLCSATDQVGDAYSPTLRGCKIPISDLPRWLPEIARQMRQVITARGRGEKGPWQFGELQWKFLT